MSKIADMTMSEMEQLGGVMEMLSSVLLMVAVMFAFIWILWFVRRKQKQTSMTKPLSISRTAFSSDCFGMVYDNQDPAEPYMHYAIVFDIHGKELCRYEEDEGQTMIGFSAEGGSLYLHTTEIYEDGTQSPSRWMFVPEHNEFVECD